MEINLKEKYLPVGTVVLLKGGKKRVMVTGFCVVSPEVEKKVFDYCGCIYPEGYLNSTQNCLFNHDQIDKIYHVGLVDEEEMKFKNQLKVIAPTIDEQFAELVSGVAQTVKETAENLKASNPVSTSENVTPAAPDVQASSVVPETPLQPEVGVQPEVPSDIVVPSAPVAPESAALNPVGEQPLPQNEAPSVINFLDESQR